MPSLARYHYHFVQTLKENGCQLIFTFNTSRHKGNYHFLWLIELNANGDEIHYTNAGVVQKLTDDMPIYHSCDIRQKFVRLFGRTVDIKLAHLREIYCELTGSLLQPLMKLRGILVNV